jgi:segregation and condensation protein B
VSDESAEDLGRSFATMFDGQSDGDAGAVSLSETETVEPSPPSLERIIEAMLFVGGAPLTSERACETIRGLTPERFAELIDLLNREYRRQGRPYWIQAQSGGFVLALKSRYRAVVDRLYGGGRLARLSSTVLDTLSIVAYRQPVTKQEVDTLRGGESGAMLKQLVRRGLVAVYQRGGDVTYGTTRRFLEVFHLDSLDDLPRTQDVERS